MDKDKVAGKIGDDGLVEGMVSVGSKAAPGSVPVTSMPERISKSKLPEGTSSELPAGASLLNRAAIIAERDKPRKRLYVPAFGGTVCLQAMRSIERDAYEQELVQQGEDGKQVFTMDNIRGKLICRLIVDEAGNRIFTDEDATLLGDLPATEMDKLWAAGQVLTGVTNADVKQLAGNSAGSRGVSSASA